MKLPPAYLLRHYGLTAEQYVELWTWQEGMCGGCMRKFGARRPACIDHDHKTFEIRGLLCSPCNLDIGFHHDRQAWYQQIADYLFLTPAQTLWGSKAPRVQDAPPTSISQGE